MNISTEVKRASDLNGIHSGPLYRSSAEQASLNSSIIAHCLECSTHSLSLPLSLSPVRLASCGDMEFAQSNVIHNVRFLTCHFIAAAQAVGRLIASFPDTRHTSEATYEQKQKHNYFIQALKRIEERTSWVSIPTSKDFSPQFYCFSLFRTLSAIAVASIEHDKLLSRKESSLVDNWFSIFSFYRHSFAKNAKKALAFPSLWLVTAFLPSAAAHMKPQKERNINKNGSSRSSVEKKITFFGAWAPEPIVRSSWKKVIDNTEMNCCLQEHNFFHLISNDDKRANKICSKPSRDKGNRKT